MEKQSRGKKNFSFSPCAVVVVKHFLFLISFVFFSRRSRFVGRFPPTPATSRMPPPPNVPSSSSSPPFRCHSASQPAKPAPFVRSSLRLIGSCLRPESSLGLLLPFQIPKRSNSKATGRLTPPNLHAQWDESEAEGHFWFGEFLP